MWIIQIEEGKYLIHEYDGTYYTQDIKNARIFRKLEDAEFLFDSNFIRQHCEWLTQSKILEIEIKIKGVQNVDN